MRRANRLAVAELWVLLVGLFLVAPAVAEEDLAPETPVDTELASPPSAMTGPEAIREARRAVEETRWSEGLALVEAIGPDAAPPIRMQALELRAVIHLLEGRSAIAQPILEELYFMAPAFTLSNPSLGPHVTKMFEEEAARPHKRAVSLELRPVGAELTSFELLAFGVTAKVQLTCRRGRSGAFRPIATRLTQGRARFRLPAQGAYACMAVAVDRDGLPLGRLGTSDAPLMVRSRLAPPPKPTIVQRWWFWTAVSGVVVGAVVVGAVAATAPDAPPDADLTIDTSAQTAATLVRW